MSRRGLRPKRMGKSQVPRGTKKKTMCEICGKLDWFQKCRGCGSALYTTKKIK